MEHRFGIEDLANLVGRGLETAGYDGQRSGRVREAPDARTIRYYTTLGLLDRPVEMRGRKALYGPRHVLQLVAIKRLQARGLSLVDVQRTLAGASDQALSTLACLPYDFWERAQGFVDTRKSRAEGRESTVEGREWAQAPVGRQHEETRSDTLRGAIPMVQDRLCRSQFWSTAPELPDVATGGPPSHAWTPRPALHLAVAEGIELVIEGIAPEAFRGEKLAALTPVLKDLAEIIRSLKESEG